jgi:flagellar motor switch protein FliN
MAEPYSAPILDQLRQNEQDFAARAGEIFRTVINLETQLVLLDLAPADEANLGALGADEWVCVEAPFIKGLPGQVVFLLEKAFTARVVDYMIMGDGEVEFMPDEHLDGIVEAVNQLMGNELTELSARVHVSLRNEVRPARLITPDELKAQFLGWVLVSFEVRIDGREPVHLHKLLSPDLAQKLGEMLGSPQPLEDSDEDFGVRPAAPASPAASPAAADNPPPSFAASQPSFGPAPAGPVHDVRQAQFTDFGPPQPAPRNSLENKLGDQSLGRVLDLRLPIVIELGRTHMLIKDIVELAPGSVIELNKLVGEPVDLYVNGKRFAQGEVVVIDENFGVRVTDLVPLDQRLKQAGEA